MHYPYKIKKQTAPYYLWTTSEGNHSRYETEVEKIYRQIRSLREQLKISEAKSEANEVAILKAEKLTELLQKDISIFDSFDEATVRRIVERICVMPDKSIRAVLKGGVVVGDE